MSRRDCAILGSVLDAARPAVASALEQRDAAFVDEAVEAQTAAGALGLDLNLGIAPSDGPATMAWLVSAAQARSPALLSLDCADVAALAAGAAACERPFLLNSTSLDEDRLLPRLGLAVAYGAWLVLQPLRLADGPLPPRQRAELMQQVIPALESRGLRRERLVLDLLAQPLALRGDSLVVALQALRAHQELMPAALTIAGIPNVSFRRSGSRGRALRRVFAVCLAGAGLDYAICDPCDPGMMPALQAASGKVSDLQGEFYRQLAAAAGMGAAFEPSPWQEEASLAADLRALTEFGGGQVTANEAAQ